MATTPSPAPGVPQTGTKAYVAAGVAFFVCFAGIWVVDADPFTTKELVAAIVAALLASGATGGATFWTSNKAT